MIINTGYYQSPIGWLEIKAFSTSLISLKFVEDVMHPYRRSKAKMIVYVINQIEEYFQNKRKVFDVPYNLNGTDFQLRVLEKVLAVPYGKTTTYTKLAIQFGSSKKARAVGNALGKNPIPIIVPCHRVIGENKELVGYSGGLWRKQWLLEHEAQGEQLRLAFKNQKTRKSKRT